MLSGARACVVMVLFVLVTAEARSDQTASGNDTVILYQQCLQTLARRFSGDDRTEVCRCLSDQMREKYTSEELEIAAHLARLRQDKEYLRAAQERHNNDSSKFGLVVAEYMAENGVNTTTLNSAIGEMRSKKPVIEGACFNR
jgi:hypothetical protein